LPFNSTTNYSFTGTDWNEVAGVYGIMNSQRQMIYVGQTDSFKRRMAEHQADKTHLMHQYAPALVVAEVIANPQVRSARERVLIVEFAPPANR
jgi:predicted GIY-YIG superfamily endonuclease